ncbi:16S rRNA (guanine(966)-N(2))-methyltransferase RsmD [Galbitalea soli]|uniref:16S rRNA (Guanine(966)-N(2))-methyltransferase RsmD n=1 Tax=Galbitalea soli TaxID=1268042 RepID=A0A7C9TRA8_9MICO|nr:16S rRNA (guanine(966)-N(2))-methyltransferase RsmD [Galbitalea soli]NEM91521.1 16S rRNA (guanine(966)-N(2))-methyltransferase RsmD [Galbitalea soli]NYJ30215.1 16S rRNA (guanine966-N2)-methyltransferase [Galbitalea soli]
MTRIIAGFAGSLTLTVPPSGTRPTSDRVREAIFSALDSRGLLDGARVLDLYAGSGALGLEAASRGATAVTLVDSSAAAASACRRNAAHIAKAAPRGAVPAIEVSASPVLSFLTGARQFWDIVFVDPPYELGGPELGRGLEGLVPRLSPDAVVVVERSARDPEPPLPEGLQLDRRKDYGDTALYWLSVPIQETTASSGPGTSR